MPYAIKFQKDRDPATKAKIRLRWKLKKRRQRARRRKEAQKHIDEGKPAYRAPDSFMRSPNCPNRAMWLLHREMRQATHQKRRPNIEIIRRAARLKTTQHWLRTKPYQSIAYRMIFASLLTCPPVGGTLVTKRTKEQSFLVRTSCVAVGTRDPGQEVVPMAPTEDDTKRTKFDPDHQFKTLAKAIQEEIARTVRNYPPGRFEIPKPAPTPEPPKKKAERRAGLTPPEEEKQRRLAEMRKALAESALKEEQSKREAQIPPDTAT